MKLYIALSVWGRKVYFDSTFIQPLSFLDVCAYRKRSCNFTCNYRSDEFRFFWKASSRKLYLDRYLSLKAKIFFWNSSMLVGLVGGVWKSKTCTFLMEISPVTRNKLSALNSGQLRSCWELEIRVRDWLLRTTSNPETPEKQRNDQKTVSLIAS